MAQSSRSRAGNGRGRSNGQTPPPPPRAGPQPRASLSPTRQKILIAHSDTPGNVPIGLEVGELGIDLATPPRMWVGCPVAVEASGVLQLLPGAAGIAEPTTAGNYLRAMNGSGSWVEGLPLAGGTVANNAAAAIALTVSATGAGSTALDVKGAPVIVGTPTGPAVTGPGNINIEGGYYVNGVAAISQFRAITAWNGNFTGAGHFIGNLQTDGQLTAFGAQTNFGTFGGTGPGGCTIRIASGRGTSAVPQPLLINDPMGGLSWAGWNGAGQAEAASIRARATQPWSVGNHGGVIEFSSVANNASAASLRMRLQEGLMVGDDTVADSGPGTVNCSGGYYVNGSPIGGGIAEPSTAGNFLRTDAGTWVPGLPLTGGTLTNNAAATTVLTISTTGVGSKGIVCSTVYGGGRALEIGTWPNGTGIYIDHTGAAGTHGINILVRNQVGIFAQIPSSGPATTTGIMIQTQSSAATPFLIQRTWVGTRDLFRVMADGATTISNHEAAATTLTVIAEGAGSTALEVRGNIVLNAAAIASLQAALGI